MKGWIFRSSNTLALLGNSRVSRSFKFVYIVSDVKIKPEIIFHVHVHVSCSSPRQKFLPIDIITVVTSRKTVWVIFAPLSMVRFREKDKFIIFRNGGMQWVTIIRRVAPCYTFSPNATNVLKPVLRIGLSCLVKTERITCG